MRILFIGDVMGRSGRDALAQYLPDVKMQLKPDVVIVNGENAAHGTGIVDKICREFYESGADIITTGNHVWDQREIILTIDRDPRLLRPINYPKGTPGRGFIVHQLLDGRKILVANAMGRVFMDPLDDPFAALNDLAERHVLGLHVQAAFIDFHAEATSEKMAAAHYLDGRVSAVVGTHTHMPTADCQILSGGTAYQTDAGMTGDYDSVIGVQKDVPIQRFTRKMPTERMQPADGPGTMCGTFIITDDKTGKATAIAPVRKGPRLSETMPAGM
jgi:metallophosphoesterase (TIGR00282 family)